METTSGLCCVVLHGWLGNGFLFCKKSKKEHKWEGKERAREKENRWCFSLPGDTLGESFISLGFRRFDGVFWSENVQEKGREQQEHGRPTV